VFKIIGMKGGYFDNVKVNIAAGVTGVKCYDIGTSAYAGSTGGFSFRDCQALLNSGEGNTGWRVGAVSAGSGADISNITWSNCTVGGGRVYGYPGQYGFHINGGNSLQFTWVGGGAYWCENAFRLDAGGCMYCYGVGGSGNAIDFKQNYVNSLTVDGNRWENGKLFLDVSGAEGHSNIMISNLHLGDYRPTDGYLFRTKQPGTLIIDGLFFYNEGLRLMTAPIVLLESNFHIGNFHMRGGAVMSNAASLIQVVSPINWKIRTTTVGKMTKGYYSDAYFPDITT
jgi:hypothetical protein